MLEARDITFGYVGAPVLRSASLVLAPGEVVGLSGPSGAGKSTFGRILAGLREPHSGIVSVDGKPLPRRGFCPVQMLFQTVELAVDPRWRIREILAEAHNPAPDLVQAFGIRESWLGRYPHELSGGELQRVAIVRSLSDRARFLVADEITGALDAISQAEIWSALLALVEQRRIGLLVISHDLGLLARVATRHLQLSDGRLLAVMRGVHRADRRPQGVFELKTAEATE